VLCVREGGHSPPAVLLSLGRFEFDLLVLIQRPAAGAGDRGEVDEYVRRPVIGAAPAGRADDDCGLAAVAVLRPDPEGSSPSAAQPLASPGACMPRALAGRDGPPAGWDLSGLTGLKTDWARRIRSGPYFASRYLGVQMYRAPSA
jgi:hypothetical protein